MGCLPVEGLENSSWFERLRFMPTAGWRKGGHWGSEYRNIAKNNKNHRITARKVDETPTPRYIFRVSWLTWSICMASKGKTPQCDLIVCKTGRRSAPIPHKKENWATPAQHRKSPDETIWRSVPLGGSKRDWKRKFLRMVRKFPMEIPFGNCGVPLKVLHTFQTKFPENFPAENYVTICFLLQTEISGFFLPDGKHSDNAGMTGSGGDVVWPI